MRRASAEAAAAGEDRQSRRARPLRDGPAGTTLTASRGPALKALSDPLFQLPTARAPGLIKDGPAGRAET